MVAYATAALNMSATGSDPTGLGRWTWMSFTSGDRHTLKVVKIYLPQYGDRTKLNSVYQQQK